VKQYVSSATFPTLNKEVQLGRFRYFCSFAFCWSHFFSVFMPLFNHCSAWKKK